MSVYFLRFLVLPNYNLNHRIGYWDSTVNSQASGRARRPKALDAGCLGFLPGSVTRRHPSFFLAFLCTHLPEVRHQLIDVSLHHQGQDLLSEEVVRNTLGKQKACLQHLASLASVSSSVKWVHSSVCFKVWACKVYSVFGGSSGGCSDSGSNSMDDLLCVGRLSSGLGPQVVF